MPNPNGTLTDVEIAAKNARANAANRKASQSGNTGLIEPGVVLKPTPVQSSTFPAGGPTAPGSSTGIGSVGTGIGGTTPVSSLLGTNAANTTNTTNKSNITTAQPGSVSYLLGDGTVSADQQFINDYIAKQTALYNTPVDEAAIRSQKEAEMQAQIDAINKVYADKLIQSKTAGQGRIGTNIAQQARGGLLGSDFGTAQQNTIQDANTQANNLVEAERLSLVNSLLSDARNNAATEIANKRAAIEAGGQALLQYYAGAPERKAAKTKNAAQKILALGKNPQDISDEELKQLGISRQDLTLEFTAAKQAQEAAQATAQAAQEKTSLENAKTQAEIDKLAAEGKMPKEVGGYIFDAQGNLIGSKYEKQNANDFLKFETENPDGSKTTYYKNPITGATVNPEQAFGDYGNNVDVSKVLSGYSPKGQELLTVPDGTVIPTRLGQVSSQNASVRGKECAEYVNDIAGTKMGNTYASKVAVCNESTGGVGSVVAWKPNGSGNFGHTGIIVGEDENNWFVKSSNYVPGTVTTEKIPKSNIKNFYTPESVKSIQQPTEQKAVKYANGNVRTSNGVLVDKADVYKINKDIINDKSYEALTASEDMKTAWDSYKKLVDKYGIEMLPGKAKGEMQTAYNGVLRAAQKFFALGVFQPYDQKAIQEMIPNYVRDLGPFGDTPSHYANPIFRQQLQGQLKGFEDFIQNKIQNEYDSLNRKYGEYKGALSGIDDVEAIYKKVSDQDLISSY